MPTARVISGLVVQAAPHAERYARWEVFAREEGFLTVTLPAKVALPYGLFDAVELTATTKGKALFAREVHLLGRPEALAKDLRAFEEAARLTNLLRAAFRQLPDYASVYNLFARALQHYAETPEAAEVVTLKALYKILQAEGFPVKEGWLMPLPAALRTKAADMLQKPLEGHPAADHGLKIKESLEAWARAELGIKG